MRWKIGECEYDSITREVRPSSVPPLGEPDAKLLEVLIERYGIKHEHDSSYENDQLIQAVWGSDGSDDSLHTSVKKLRDAFGGEIHSYFPARPFRLAVRPEPITGDEFVYESGIIVGGSGASASEQSTELSSGKKETFTLVVDGMIINSVSELINNDPETEGIREICAASYERSLGDLAFATVYADRLVTGKDFRPSLTTPDQPGQDLAARLGEICDQQAFPSEITDGHLLRDLRSRNGIRDDIRRFSQCLADNRTAHFFRDYMLREATKHLGTDISLFQEDIDPAKYQFNVKRPYYTDHQLQDTLGIATDVLVNFLPKTPRNSTDQYAKNALREFAARNVLSLITIMWEGEEYAKKTGARRAPHILRALVDMKRSRDRSATQHQEIVRDLVVEHALTTALRSRQKKNRHNIVGVLLNLRDDYPFKQIRKLLNDAHLILVESDPKKEQVARNVLKQLKVLTTSTSMRPDKVHLALDTVVRALTGNRSSDYEYELYRVFPELRPDND